MAAEQKVEQVVETPPAPPIEDITIIKGELAKLKTELEQKDRGFKSLQQSLTQRDRELKSQSDLSSKLSSIDQRLEEQRQISELQAAAIALGREGSAEELEKVNQLLRSKVAEQENNRKQSEIRRQQEQSALAAKEYNQKADAVFAQAQTLFEGDDLKDIEDLLLSGNLIIAQREVRLASKGKTPAPKAEPPKETDAELRERIFTEEALVRYPDLFKSDTGSPGGSSMSEEKIRQDYRDNPDNPAIRNRYMSLRKEKGY